MNRVLISIGILSQAGMFFTQLSAREKKMNVLFIAVDDLKPVTGSYGDQHAKTPGMDRLAREGIQFQNCYCQQAISAATRASLLTGMYPDKTRVWDLVTDLRQVNPNVTTLPQHFRTNGYETAGMGKIFHKESAGPGHDAPSWSIPYRDAGNKMYALPYSPNAKGRGPATECADVPDNTYRDGRLTEMAVNLLDSLSRGDKPFFMAVGYLKPHLPFVAPKKYWDLYERNDFDIATFQKKAVNSPDLAYHISGELKNYSDIPDFNSFSAKETDHLPVDKQKELIHGYYAAMSYTDAQIMKLIKELDRLGIRDNTIIVLWGDHGWHLGDHGLWNKHTNFEEATHALMMMSIPGLKSGIKAEATSEFVDIFPTLCDLVNIPKPKYLDGISLVPAIKNPSAEIRGYALSQYPRGNDKMGYSIRTKQFRYTVWFGKSWKTNNTFDEKAVIAREMYDYYKDPLETENVADKTEYQKERLMMDKLFRECMLREFNSCAAYAEIADFRVPIDTSTK
jgi:iduronate 2-sulfatase